MTIDTACARVNPSKELIVAELRVLSSRCRLFLHEIDAIGLALAEGILTPERALARMRDIGAVLMCDELPGDTIR
jgi:hypothetical protein